MNKYAVIDFSYDHKIILPVEEAVKLIEIYRHANKFESDFSGQNAKILTFNKAFEFKFISEKVYNEITFSNQITNE
jgi:hypothetical protein